MPRADSRPAVAADGTKHGAPRPRGRPRKQVGTHTASSQAPAGDGRASSNPVSEAKPGTHSLSDAPARSSNGRYHTQETPRKPSVTGAGAVPMQKSISSPVPGGSNKRARLSRPANTATVHDKPDSTAGSQSMRSNPRPSPPPWAPGGSSSVDPSMLNVGERSSLTATTVDEMPETLRPSTVVSVDFVVRRDGAAQLVKQRIPVDAEALREMQRSASWAGEPNGGEPTGGSPADSHAGVAEDASAIDTDKKISARSGLMMKILDPTRTREVERRSETPRRPRLVRKASASLVATSGGAAMVRASPEGEHTETPATSGPPAEGVATPSAYTHMGSIYMTMRTAESHSLPSPYPSNDEEEGEGPEREKEAEGEEEEAEGELRVGALGDDAGSDSEDELPHEYPDGLSSPEGLTGDDDLDARSAIKRAYARQQRSLKTFSSGLTQAGDPALIASPLRDSERASTPVMMASDPVGVEGDGAPGARRRRRLQCDACKMIFRTRYNLRDHERVCSVKQTPFLSSDFFTDDETLRADSAWAAVLHDAGTSHDSAFRPPLSSSTLQAALSIGGPAAGGPAAAEPAVADVVLVGDSFMPAPGAVQQRHMGLVSPETPTKPQQG